MSAPVMLLLLLFPSISSPAIGGADYLETGVGARWAGMGGSARASARDTTAGYWNPAGLAAQGPSEWQFGSMLAVAPLGRELSWLSVSLQTDRAGTWSAGWMRNSVDGLESVDGSGRVGPADESVEDAFFLSHGGSLLYQLKWGITAKGLSHRLFGYSGRGAGVDAGLLVQPFLDHEIFIGLTAENLASRFSWDTGTIDRLPRAFSGGFSVKVFQDAVMVSADAVSREGESGLLLHSGMEYWAFSQMAVRAGLDGSKPAVGATYLSRPYQADYAFVYDGAGLGSRHLVSFSLVY